MVTHDERVAAIAGRRLRLDRGSILETTSTPNGHKQRLPAEQRPG
jgi:hypothetical protein